MKALEAALRLKASVRTERERRKPVKRWPRPRYPHGEEVVYYKRLRYFLEFVQHIVRRDIVPILPGLLDETGPTRRLDAASDIDAAFAAAIAAAQKGLPEKTIEAVAQSTALRVSEWSADQFQQQVQRVVKVNLYDDTSGLAEHLDLFVSDNVKLIKDLTGGHLADIKGVVTRGARAGLRHEEVAAQIERQFGVAKNRAALIATDQIGKLNGELNKLRQTNLGVRRYRWSTSLDERVRKSHRNLEDTIQEWARPPVVDERTGERGHPGQPIRCRCSAIPIIDDVLAEAGLIAWEDVEVTHPRQGAQPPLRTPPAPLPGRIRPPTPPTPPTPPPVPPPPVRQRNQPPINPAELLGRTLPTQAQAKALEEAAARSATAGRIAAEESAEKATVEAAREWVRQARAARRAGTNPPPWAAPARGAAKKAGAAKAKRKRAKAR
jgi:SPP1 gp7 family putative phage head morphogenesis protein